MFRKKGGSNISNVLKCELCGIAANFRRIIPALTAGALIILISWFYFGGPCRVTMFFRIPGGGFTITMYYVLWFIIFAAAGGECVLINLFCRRTDRGRRYLYHAAAHVLLLLWYPLFFVSYAQFLAFMVILAAAVLLLISAKECASFTCALSIINLIKAIITAIFTYINLVFLIIN